MPLPTHARDESVAGRRLGCKRGQPQTVGPGGGGSLSRGLCAGDQGRGSDRLQGLDGAGHEGGLLFEHAVVDRKAEAFVQDFDAEEFRRGGGAVLVGHGAGDVEGQDLIGIPGQGGFFESFLGPPRRHG